MQGKHFKSAWCRWRWLAGRGGRAATGAWRSGLAVEFLEDRRVLSAAIDITHLPDYGADGVIQGVVTGVDPATHVVAPYIYIDGAGWWTKPTNAAPTVPIHPDGTFTADVVTGGIDDRAVIYCAAVVPSGYVPPVASGAVSIPDSLAYLAIDCEQRFGRSVDFSGHTWGVKETPQTAQVGPGGNRFSYDAADVFVDGQGLHLTVPYRNGVWWSTEVTLDEPLGYGTYCFQTNSELDDLDVNVTFGAFTWDPYGDERSGASANREIDFEDGRWGNPVDSTNAQMVVQPYHSPPDNLRRYTLPDLAGDTAITRFFTWEPDRIKFTAVRGHHDPCGSYAPGDVIDEWVYPHDPAGGHYVPTAGRAQFKFNLWIYGASAPAGGAPVEVVISDFHYEPLSDQIGYHRNNAFAVDVNGNGIWEGPAGGDATYYFGLPGDTPITGDFNGDGTDEIGFYRDSARAFCLDLNGNGIWEGPAGGDSRYFFGLPGDTPITGDFNGDGTDEIGFYRDSARAFCLDLSGNGLWEGPAGGDARYFFGLPGDTPITGDFNGDGTDEIGFYRDSARAFCLDLNGNGLWEGPAGGDARYYFGLPADTPITGDWNGDGTDEIGFQRNNAFCVDLSGNGIWEGPAGGDAWYFFGLPGDTPIIGNWAQPSPLLATAGPALTPQDAADLTTADLAPIVDHAVAAFLAEPLTPGQQQQIDRLDVRIADLPGVMLGHALGTTITIDINAAGHGWFVDPTPGQDEEFTQFAGNEYRANRQSEIGNRQSFDLLTAVMHEIGHVLGHGHDEAGVMQADLPAGTRRLWADTVDTVFAGDVDT